MVTKLRFAGAALALAMTMPALTARAEQPAPLPEPYRQMLHADTLVKGGDGAYGWQRDGAGLWYAGGGTVRLIDARTGHTRLMLDEARLRAALGGAYGDAAKAGPLPLDSFQAIDPGHVRLIWGGVAGTLDVASYRIDRAAGATPVAPGRFLRNLFMYSGFPVPDAPSPDHRRFATVEDGNVVVKRVDGPPIQLTTDAIDRDGWDVESGRRDLANMRGAPTSPWSPDGAHLFAMKIDRRQMPQVPDAFPLHDPTPIVTWHDWYKAGGPYYHYTPAILDVATRAERPVRGVDFGEDHVMLLGWADDGRTVYVGRLDHAFRHADIIAIDAATATARIIYTETAVADVRPVHQVIYAGNLGFTLLPGNRGFLWLSQRDGWQQIYHYDPAGRLVRKLTTAAYPVDNVEGYDPATGRVYFTARSDPARAYDVHLLSVPLAGGRVTRLTSGIGIHHVTLAPDYRSFVDRFSSPDNPPAIELRATDGRLIAAVDRTDITALKAAGWLPPIEFKVKSGDGRTDIFGVMYRPFNFDPAKRYPVIEDIYGGGPMINGDHQFTLGADSSANPLALAQLGYLVVKFDTEGTVGRSRAFELAIIDKWGPGLVADHAAVIRHLGEAYPFVDAGRVGIYGHSWGGYNTLMALATQDDVYKAGVATAPGGGWGDVVRDAFMETYFGAPKDHPEPWARADLKPYIDRIERPLMLGAGTQDYGLYPYTLRVEEALIQRGFLHEFIVAPGSSHGIYGANGDYFQEKTARFFLAHIPAGGVAAERH